MLLRGFARGLLRGLKRGLGVSIQQNPITVTHLVTSGTTTDAASFLTPSISPGFGVVYLGVVSQIAGGPAAPTVTGCNLSWVLEKSRTLGSTRALFVYRAMGTPTAGQVTIDYGAATQTAISYSIVECGNVNQSGTSGSGATRQSVPATAAAATTIASTLAAMESPTNVHLCFVALDTNTAIASDTAFTQLGQDGRSTNAVRLQSEWAIGDLVCDPTFASATVAVISLEVVGG